jgi:hypothetical protein
VAASATASQLGPYAYTSGKVILVVGSQKVVPDLEAALRRIREHILPWEDAQIRAQVPTGSFVGNRRRWDQAPGYFPRSLRALVTVKP